MKYVLALDQGTTSSRAILFDSSGRIVSKAQREIRQIYPAPGWLEHNPSEIWESQLEVAQEAIDKGGIPKGLISALGITNQRETTIIWNRKSGQPIRNAIVWQDRRTKTTCDALISEGLSDLIGERTGLVIDSYFSATKIAWILDNTPNARKLAEAGELAFGTVDSWLIWKLTGGAVHATDITNASRTLLFNVREGRWDEKLLEIFKVPRSILPEVKLSSDNFGEATGELSGISICSVAGDQQAALFGQMCTSPGMVKNTYGTGCFLLMHAGNEFLRSNNRLITTAACQTSWTVKEYALEGSVYIAGAAVQWLRDGLGIIKGSHEIEALANSVNDANGVHIVPAFSGLGAPHWNSAVRGIITGITGGTTKAHIARATLESIAFQTADVVAAMRADCGSQIKELRVDGGASANNFLLQFQADILGIPVLRPVVSETTALGAAFLAGKTTGVWKNLADMQSVWELDRRFEPKITDAQRFEFLDGWSVAVSASKAAVSK